MAEGKKSFVLYVDYMESFLDLTDEEAGVLIKTIFKYCNDEEPEIPQSIKQSFNLIKKDLKRDLDKWRNTLNSRSKAGKMSAEARAKKKEQETTKSTSVKCVEQKQHKATNSTVNVNDNVNVNVNVNDNNKNITSYEDNILSQTLRYWNDKVKQYRNDSFKVSTHKTITPSMEKAINKAIQLYGFNNLTLAIEHYMISGSDKNYYFKYVWSLEEFCKQSNALPEFLNEGSKWTNYCNSVQGCKRQEQTLLDQITIEDMKEFFI